MSWTKYPDLEPYKRLPNDGREFLGKNISVTEKRDGENVGISLDELGNVIIQSRNMPIAEDDIQKRLKETPEYNKIVQLLRDEKYNWGSDLIVFGELLKEISPTRIEPRKKNIHWVMFDIFSKTQGTFWDYTQVYMRGYHFKIPVVKLLTSFCPMSMTELDDEVQKFKKWCKRHRREGVVLKWYGKDKIIFSKEKIDLPDKPKIERPPREDINYPDMPEERIIRALQHAWDELGGDEALWKDKSKAMPVVARHISAEANEHNYKPPKNFYSWYINTPIEIINVRNLQ